ncbi:MAG: glycosyltransferase [Elusimicrobia bacterium]|nr:glycosyltransferase [Elusimicrobiota bacterium]
MARLSTALVTVSMANRDWALSLGIGRADQYHLVRAGVQLKLFRSTTRRPNAPQGIHVTMNQKLITTIGPFKPQKNLFDFIEAAALIHKTQPDSRFLIVGDGALRPDLEELIRKKKLTEVIMMPGWRRDIPHIFMRTNVFVMTSLWEGLPCALVEAMASGLPCVANAVDGVTDVIAEGVNGYLTVPKRPEQTADRVIHLLENPLVALEMGQKARESIGLEFDIDQMVRQQEDIYKAVR